MDRVAATVALYGDLPDPALATELRVVRGDDAAPPPAGVALLPADRHTVRRLRALREADRAMATWVLLAPDAPFDARLAQLATGMMEIPATPARWSAFLAHTTGQSLPIAADGDMALELPTLPASVTDLLALLDTPNTPARAIADGIETAPALAASVLALANSAFYGVPRRMASIQEATVHLGATTIRMAVLTCQVFDTFDLAAGRRLKTRAQRRLMHARELGPIPDEAVTASLLLDAGTLLLQSEKPDHVRSTSHLDWHARCEADTQECGADRDLLGAALLAHWQLPDAVIRAVALARHPYPRLSNGLDATAVAAIADGLLEGRSPDPSWARAMGVQRAALQALRRPSGAAAAF